jgi:SSS family solute:Na+ symporter
MYVSRTKEVTVESYFFANRNTHWFVLGLSFITSWIFSLYFLGLTFAGSTSGLVAAYVVVSAFMLVILGWFLAPRFLNIKINTIPEYFEKRFDRNCKFYISALYIFYNVFLRLIIILVAGSVFISNIAGIDAFSSLLIILIITGIYVIIGGLQAEIYVNIVQVLFIIIGVLGFSVWVIIQSDRMPSILDRIASFDVSSEPSWMGLIFGLPIMSFWFWCADQFIVQKVLSVRNVNSVRKAVLFSGSLQIILILLGIIAIALSSSTSSDELVHTLFSNSFLPDSLHWGLVIAVAAVLMSSFASLLNTTSLLITFDFYRAHKPLASDRKLVLVGRMTTMILLLYAILLIPVSQIMDFGLCLKLFKILAYFAAMIVAVLVISLFNQRIHAKSALRTLYAGTGIILVRSVLEIFLNNNQGLGNNLLNLFVKSDFLDFSVFIFSLSILFLFVFNRIRESSTSNAFVSESHPTYISTEEK